VADVLGQRRGEGVPVEVVGVLADELVDRAEGGLDPRRISWPSLERARGQAAQELA